MGRFTNSSVDVFSCTTQTILFSICHLFCHIYVWFAMLRYGVEKLGVRRYEAKIKCINAPSLRLFQQALGFQEVSLSQVFQAGFHNPHLVNPCFYWRWQQVSVQRIRIRHFKMNKDPDPGSGCKARFLTSIKKNSTSNFLFCLIFYNTELTYKNFIICLRWKKEKGTFQGFLIISFLKIVKFFNNT